MNILILSRFTPEVLKWSSHSYYYVLIYILAALMSWTRVYTCFIYSRQFNTPLVYKSHSNILREEYLYSYPSNRNLIWVELSSHFSSIVWYALLIFHAYILPAFIVHWSTLILFFLIFFYAFYVFHSNCNSLKRIVFPTYIRQYILTSLYFYLLHLPIYLLYFLLPFVA